MTAAAPENLASSTEMEREAAERAAQAAAPAVEQVEAVGGLADAARPALYALISSLADNKYVLGRRYAEWCTGAPMLESAVAAAAMAQDELGHARSFYPLLRGFPEATAADTVEERGWQNRPTSALACLDHRFGAWPDFVAANLVVDSAFTTLLEAATDSPYEPLRQRARKIVQEEQAHRVHAHGWTRRLATDDQTRETLAASLAKVWDHALAWYGRSDDTVLGALTQAGLLASGPDDLRDSLKSRLADSLAGAGYVDGLFERVLPWDRWDGQARRLLAGA